MTTTGIPELDAIVNDKEALSVEPIEIKKVIFDSVFLPLLVNEVKLPSDEAFNHIKTIWINYCGNVLNKRSIGYRKDGNRVEYKEMKGNAIFTPLKIVDENGQLITVTPSLLEPQILVGSNVILEAFSDELKHNPDLAKVKLINSIKKYTISTNENWVTFLKNYGVSTEKIDEDYEDLIVVG